MSTFKNEISLKNYFCLFAKMDLIKILFASTLLDCSKYWNEKSSNAGTV